jgi:hypothetical protein
LLSHSELQKQLEGGFRGYRSVARIELGEQDLVSGNWIRHAEPGEGRPLFEPAPPFGLVEILEREQPFDDSHGATRLAILFLGSDGFAAYDALFCQDNHVPPPFCIVSQDHGFGGNFDSFGKGGLLERLAQRTNVFPKFLLVGDNATPWEHYNLCKAVEQLIAPQKARPFKFKLPPLRSVSDAQDALAKIIAGVAGGKILSDEAQILSGIVNSFLRSIEIADLETRLVALERANTIDQPAVQYNA